MKSILDNAVILIIIAVLLIFSGCATPPKRKVQPVVPANYGHSGSSPIAFSRLVFRMPSGADLGAHYTGLLRVERFRHTWTAGLTIASDEFKIIANERMKLREYTVLGGDVLFYGRDDSTKAEFQLGGTVQSLHHNTYSPNAGNFSEADVTIEWQLNNTLRDEVVYKKTSYASATSDGVGIECVKNAFLIALDDLLSDPGFIGIVKLKKETITSTFSEAVEVIEIYRPVGKRSVNLPGNMDEALNSSLLIRAGTSVGSGVVISEDGYALTAAHVVYPLKDVNVRIRSGLELTANVIRVNTKQDIALIKLPGRGHSYLPILDYSTPTLGSDVYAIGAPTGEGLAFSVTKGVISGFRKVRGRQYIQTDTSLNPGNSGGPLLSSSGHVIGIVSWKIMEPGFEGLSFGVPVSAIIETLNIKFK